MVYYRFQSFSVLLLPETQFVALRLRGLHQLRVFSLNLHNVMHRAASLLQSRVGLAM